jgi:hypothetical protein
LEGVGRNMEAWREEKKSDGGGSLWALGPIIFSSFFLIIFVFG